MEKHDCWQPDLKVEITEDDPLGSNEPPGTSAAVNVQTLIRESLARSPVTTEVNLSTTIDYTDTKQVT